MAVGPTAVPRAERRLFRACAKYCKQFDDWMRDYAKAHPLK